MKRFKIILVFAFFMLSNTVLFQNCAEMQAANPGSKTASDSDNNGNGRDDVGEPRETREVPEFLSNREIVLDNKIVANQLLESIWTVGGQSDIVYYETNYKATYESTMVTVTGDGMGPILTVVADDCEESRRLNEDERVTVSDFFVNYIGATEIRQRAATDAPVEAGCSFPRLALDTKAILPDDAENAGQPAVDFDLFFTTPECTPDNEFYLTDSLADDPTNPTTAAEALAAVESFFHAQIDLLCP